VPSLPVKPCTKTFDFLFTRMLIDLFDNPDSYRDGKNRGFIFW